MNILLEQHLYNAITKIAMIETHVLYDDVKYWRVEGLKGSVSRVHIDTRLVLMPSHFSSFFIISSHFLNGKTKVKQSDSFHC